jgi:hypothetical protein
MNKTSLDLYTDYLLSTYGAATATGLSAMVQAEVSHDQVARFLSVRDYTSKDLWQQAKATLRSIQSEEGVLIFDDTIQEKAWMHENELMCWHYDHVSGVSAPVAFELVRKPIVYCGVQTRQLKRKSEVSKNEMVRLMIATCIQNALPFRFVLMDSWFSARENFDFIISKGRDFIAALKDNHLFAPSEQDEKTRRFTRVDTLQFAEQSVVRGYLLDDAKEVLLVRQVFTRTVRTQSNHVFLSICAALKLQTLSIKTKLNPFALCRRLLINASRTVYAELQQLRAAA